MSKWYVDKGEQGDIVLSTRVRLARNLEEFPFPCRLDTAGKIKVNEKVRDTLLAPYNDLDAVRAALREKVGAPLGTDEEGAAESIIRVADSNMNNALKLISVRRGYDPRDFTMVAFGGGARR